MLNKFRDWCDLHFDKYMPKVNGEWKYEGSFGYYAEMILYVIIQITLFIILGKIFDNYLFIIIGSIVYNSIMIFSYAFHCHKLDNCIIITQILFIIFGTLSKITPLWVIFLLCLYSCRDIYNKAPIELNSDFNRDKDWYFKRITFLITMYLIISIIFYYLRLELICKIIMLSLIMVNLMLFKNDKEYI